MSADGAQERVRAMAAKMREAFAGGVPALDSHAQCLELSSRLCGAQHWHELQSLDVKRSGKEVANSRLAGGDPVASSAVLVGALQKGQAGVDALRQEPGGLRVDVFAQSLRPALPMVLRRVASCMEPASGWSASAWSMRALGLFDAALPAIFEGERSGAWAIDAGVLASFATWEGISKLRSGCHGMVSDESLGPLREWARPWHSSYAKDLAAEESFESAALMWGRALDWLAALAAGGGASWEAMRSSNPGRVLVEADGAPMALASALLDFEGVEASFATEGLDGEGLVAASRWFMPQAIRVNRSMTGEHG